MRTLIFQRHGEYIELPKEQLTEIGRARIEMKAVAISQIVGTQSVRVIASSAPRARESASIVAARLSTPVQFDRALQDDRCDLAEIEPLIERHRDEVDVLVLVAHRDHVHLLPMFFAEGYDHNDVDDRMIPYGHTAIIDVPNRSVRFI